MKSRDQNYNLGWTHVFSPKATFDANAFARALALRAAALGGRHAGHGDLGPQPRQLRPERVGHLGPGSPPRGEGRAGSSSASRSTRLQLRPHRPRLQRPRRRRLQPRPRALRPHARRPASSSSTAQRTGTYAAGYVQDNVRYRRLHRQPRPALRPQQPADDRGPAPAPGRPRLLHRRRRGTVLRASYNRVFVTPEYENILFSSSELAASVVPPEVKDSRELGGGVLLIRSERQNAYTGGRAAGDRARSCVSTSTSGGAGPRTPATRTSSRTPGIVFPIAFDAGRHNGWDVAPRPGRDPWRPRLRLPRSHPRHLRAASGGRPLPRRRRRSTPSPAGRS